MLDFENVVYKAGEQFKPSLIANYLYELSKEFNKLYKSSSIKHAESKKQMKTRLLLFHCVSMILKLGLNLIGIKPPERM